MVSPEVAQLANVIAGVGTREQSLMGAGVDEVLKGRSFRLL